MKKKLNLLLSFCLNYINGRNYVSISLQAGSRCHFSKSWCRLAITRAHTSPVQFWPVPFLAAFVHIGLNWAHLATIAHVRPQREPWRRRNARVRSSPAVPQPFYVTQTKAQAIASDKLFFVSLGTAAAAWHFYTHRLHDSRARSHQSLQLQNHSEKSSYETEIGTENVKWEINNKILK